MKVLLVSALPPPAGGIATWTERYLEYCMDHDITTLIVNIALNGARGQRINDTINVKDELKRSFRVLRNMYEQVKTEGITVVHLNTSCGSFGIFRDYLCIKMAHKRKIPIITQFHCNIENQVHGFARIWTLKRLIKMTDRILVLNSASDKYVSPFSERTPSIVPNFINKDFLVEAHQIKEHIKEVLFVGHVQKTKGVLELFEAASQLPDVHFTLIGPIADEIAKLICPSNVLLVGPKNPDEVKQYLLESDIYLFPSYTEGFSLSLTEAMATGLPAIATDVGANRDMLEGKGGVIIPIKDSNAIVEAIIKLDNKQLRQSMSKWAIEKVRNYYLTSIVMEQLIDIYTKMGIRN